MNRQCNNIMQYFNHEQVLDLLDKGTTQTETEVAEKSSWDQANRGEKLGLVWRNQKENQPYYQ